MVMVGKFFFGVKIREGEDEVESFNSFKNFVGPMWPYMKQTRDTQKPLITVDGKPMICISSYSYLDLTKDPRVQEAAIEAARAYSTGNHGPRMLCGNLEILEQLEVKLSEFFKREAALIMSSGYLACMSVIQGFARQGDLLLMDKLSHASLKSGAKLSGAKIVYFKHNDFVDAELKIKQNKNMRLIMVIEGVYSMDGDVGHLPSARALCDKYKGTLILDEAHSVGVIGKTGRGTEEYFNYTCKADIICGTFTKSLASVGGFITCSRDLREFYTFNATGAVFSAPLSAYHCGAVMKALEIIIAEPERVFKLQQNTAYLINKFKEKGFNTGQTVSCVIPVIFKETKHAMILYQKLMEKGFFTSLVMAPACAINAPRFRITALVNMDVALMDRIVDAFVDVTEKNKADQDALKFIKYL